MAEEGFEVHGAHDHALEHAAEHGGKDRFIGRIAVTTAILATVGALFSYQSGTTQANAGLFKNDAAIKKTEAADQWGFYQAKNNRLGLAELALSLLPTEKQPPYKEKIAQYTAEKEDIKREAEKLEVEAKAWDERSEYELHKHHLWSQATTFLQIAIALSAIALLTRKKWLQWGVYGISLVGVAWGLLAIF